VGSNQMNMQNEDTTEQARRVRQAELNAPMSERAELEKKHGQIWDKAQLLEQFEVIGFMAPFVVVKDRKTGQRGSLEFQHGPRFYFNWLPDKDQ